IAQMAPTKFTERAKLWWNALPQLSRLNYSQDWEHLLDAIRRHFLTAEWVRERTREFEEMRFRQKGHEGEDPLDFFQRRQINELTCPNIDALMDVAQHTRKALLSSWMLTNQVHSLLAQSGSSASTNAAARHRYRRVNFAEKPLEGSGDESEGSGRKVKEAKSANLITVDLEPGLEEADLREYIAMTVESHKSSTAYSSEGAGSPEVRKEIFVVDALHTNAKAAHVDYRHGYNRNRRRCEAFSATSLNRKSKGKAVISNDPQAIPRREMRKLTPPSELPSSVQDGQKIYAARKMRQLPDGLGSLGSRALHVLARIGGLSITEINARLDSGADITLMSEFWASIPGLPKPREGLRMKLYHLTGQAKVLGYIKTLLYLVSKEGEVISFELEAYVVRNMKVPLLLGEDFQSTYELGIQRLATGHCDVQIGKTRHVVAASSAHAVDLGFEIRQASMAKSMKPFSPASGERRIRGRRRVSGRKERSTTHRS
ncbi:hypothetical protein B0H12DRAFT_1022481, partial [Mycena haematopus]